MATNEKVQEVMQSVTDRIVTMIAEGIADPGAWQKSWKGISAGLSGAQNASTRKHYRGGNAVLLAVLEWGGDAVGPWGTYKQWESLGAQVRKGSKATWILVPKTVKRTDDEGKESTRVFFNAAPVFASSMVDGYEAPEKGTLVPADGWIAEVVKGADVTVWPGQPACARNGAVVYMPEREQFSSDAAWFCTFAHELTHWSGYEGRAGQRTKGSTFGDPAYAAEELVAELGAAMAAALVGVDSEPRADHAHYLAHWLKACEGEKGAERLWDIASAASKAVAWLDEQREVTK